MRLVKSLQRRRLTMIALVVACAMMGGVAVWQASKRAVEASSIDLGRGSKLPAQVSAEDKQRLQERVHKGVGSEVRFTSVAEPEQIAEAVGSTADFIYWRSGLRMSDATKKRIVEAEGRVLSGEVGHITIEELIDNLTATVAERLTTLTDEELRQAAEVSSDEHGEIRSRANGKWGVLTQKELIRQAKSGRDWSQRGDSALRSALRSMIEEEVNDRVSTLGAALPEQFGQTRAQGLTPTRALLIAYSVAADDLLADSRSDIEQMLAQKRIDARQTREQRTAQKDISGRPYGPRGLFHPSAPHLFFTRAGVEKMLNLSAGGEK